MVIGLFAQFGYKDQIVPIPGRGEAAKSFDPLSFELTGNQALGYSGFQFQPVDTLIFCVIEYIRCPGHGRASSSDQFFPVHCLVIPAKKCTIIVVSLLLFENGDKSFIVAESDCQMVKPVKRIQFLIACVIDVYLVKRRHALIIVAIEIGNIVNSCKTGDIYSFGAIGACSIKTDQFLSHEVLDDGIAGTIQGSKASDHREVISICTQHWGMNSIVQIGGEVFLCFVYQIEFVDRALFGI